MNPHDLRFLPRHVLRYSIASQGTGTTARVNVNIDRAGQPSLVSPIFGAWEILGFDVAKCWEDHRKSRKKWHNPL